MKTDVFIRKIKKLDFINRVIASDESIIIKDNFDNIAMHMSKIKGFSMNTQGLETSSLNEIDKSKLIEIALPYLQTAVSEREYATPFKVKEGDLVIESKPNSAHIYFVEGLDLDEVGRIESVLLVDGRKDKLFGREYDEQSKQSVKESMDDFYRNFKLLAKKENLED